MRKVSIKTRVAGAALMRLYEPPAEVTSWHQAKVSTSGPLDQTVTKALQRLARIQMESPRPSS